MKKQRCRMCKELLLLHNFTVSNGYPRKDCKECHNEKQRKIRVAQLTRNIDVAHHATIDTQAGVTCPNCRDLQKKVKELEQEADELNDEIIKLLKEQDHGA